VGGQGEGGNGGGILIAPVRGDGNGEGEAMVCDHCQRGGCEVAPRCWGGRHNEERHEG
jgi:hypothetical protein